MKKLRMDNLCIWKDLFNIYANEGLHHGSSTFSEYDEWDENHPLYKCIGCDGYDFGCKGYHPLGRNGRDR